MRVSERLVRIAWWWNGSFGTGTRKDVYLEMGEQSGILQVRWRGGMFTDRDGILRTRAAAQAVAACAALVGETKEGWKEWIDEELLDRMMRPDIASDDQLGNSSS